MKVLFLDIDGVLNSLESARKYGTYDILIPDALGYIQRLADNGIEIVVSSTWRKGRTIEQLEKVLGVKVHDVTPVIHSVRVRRGEEIAAWLSLNKCERFAILDDDSDMLEEQLPFFVQTDTTFGMDQTHFERLRKLLLDI